MRKLVHPGSTSAAASAVGRANTKVDTKPEVQIRSLLHRSGYRFRKNHLIKLPGRRGVRPDIVFPGERVVVFVDGCFWHCCPQHGTMPRSNPEYWQPKLLRNVERDRGDLDDLEAVGWTALRIWEHVTPVDAVEQITAVVEEKRRSRPRARARKGD